MWINILHVYMYSGCAGVCFLNKCEVISVVDNVIALNGSWAVQRNPTPDQEEQHPSVLDYDFVGLNICIDNDLGVYD